MTLSELNSKLTNDPYDRIGEETKELLQHPKRLFDIHCHTFNIDDVPTKFLGFRLPLLNNVPALDKLEDIMVWAHKEKYAEFLDFILANRNEVVKKTIQGYPGARKVLLAPLLMDMLPSMGGEVTATYQDQIDSMYTSMSTPGIKGRLLPFVCLNPVREEFQDYFVSTFNPENEHSFFGVKIYPSLGYFPSHPKLMEVFKICEEKKIPITTHVSSALTKNADDDLENVLGDYYDPKTGYKELKQGSHNFRNLDKEDFRTIFNNPFNWRPVLEKFPNLKLNLAHFGGLEEWELHLEGRQSLWIEEIIRLTKEYPNVYTDFSYTCALVDNVTGLRKLIDNSNHPHLLKKVMYGTDSFLVSLEGNIQRCYELMKSRLATARMREVSVNNPKRFLFD